MDPTKDYMAKQYPGLPKVAKGQPASQPGTALPDAEQQEDSDAIESYMGRRYPGPKGQPGQSEAGN